MSTAKNITVREFLDKLGRPRVVAETGIRHQELWRASRDNLMPSGWFPAIEGICADDGIECPRHLFRWTAAKRGAA